MSDIRANVCDGCKEIWSQFNLITFKLGKHELHLCPECAAAYEKSGLQVVNTQLTNGERIEKMLPGGTKRCGIKTMYYTSKDYVFESSLEWWNAAYSEEIGGMKC